MGEPEPASPPKAAPRRFRLLLAAWACWLIGSHAAVVPGVVGFTLFALGSEEGWGNLVGSGAGLALAAMGVASVGSSLALIHAGLDFYRGRTNRAGWQVVIAFGLALLTAGLMFSR